MRSQGCPEAGVGVALSDHLIRPDQQRPWDGEPGRLRGLEIAH